MRALTTGLFLVLLLVGGSARAAESTLDSVKSVLTDVIMQIDRGYSDAVSAAFTQYARDLTEEREAYRRAGDLDGLLGVDREIERFTNDRDVPDSDDKKLPVRVRRTRAVCRKAVIEASRRRQLKLLELMEFYGAKLDSLQKDLVGRNAIDEALRVRAEARRIESITADMDKRMPAPEVRFNPEPVVLPSGLSTGLLVYFDFNEYRKGKVMDRSRHGRQALVNHAEWLADARGPGNGAYDLTTDSRITCPMPAFHVGDASVSFWIKHRPLPTQQNDHNLFCLSGSGPKGGRLYVKPRVDHGTWHIGVGESRRSPSEKPSFGEWQLFTLVVDDGKASLYLNSKLTGFKIESSPFDTGEQLEIGGDGRCAPAQIDDVMVWERALSPEDVSALYKYSVAR